jgi:hypothetical protein
MEEPAAWTHVDLPGPRSQRALILLAVATSALLLLVHTGIDDGWERFKGVESLTLWYTALIPGPLLVALLLGRDGDATPWIAGALYLAVLMPLAWHTGHAASPGIADGASNVIFPYVLSLAIATFVLAPFVQTWRRSRWPLAYASLFQNAWNNALTLAIAVAFTGAFWLILALWAALFDLLGIKFFSTLFGEHGFVYPVTGLLAGFGLVLGRTLMGAVRTLLSICLALGRALFPVIATLALVFLCALAVNRLDPLWKTGHATALLDALVLGAVLLINAVLQDGEKVRAYRRPVDLLANGALLALPVFAVIALYAVHLRTDQYGWTPERLWGALVTCFAALYALSYALGVVVRRERWLALAGPANVAIAALLVVTLLLTQSPLLDFRRISVANQLARSDDVTKIDLRFLRFDAGRPGQEALVALQSDPRVQGNFALLADIGETLKRNNRWEASPSAMAGLQPSDFDVRPDGTPLPEGLLAAVKNNPSYGGDRAQSCRSTQLRCALVEVGLAADGSKAWVFVDPAQPGRMPVYGSAAGAWKRIGHLNAHCCDGKKLVAALATGDFAVTPPKWNDLRVGDTLFRFAPED